MPSTSASGDEEVRNETRSKTMLTGVMQSTSDETGTVHSIQRSRVSGWTGSTESSCLHRVSPEVLTRATVVTVRDE